MYPRVIWVSVWLHHLCGRVWWVGRAGRLVRCEAGKTELSLTANCMQLPLCLLNCSQTVCLALAQCETKGSHKSLSCVSHVSHIDINIIVGLSCFRPCWDLQMFNFCNSSNPSVCSVQCCIKDQKSGSCWRFNKTNWLVLITSFTWQQTSHSKC